MKLTVNNIDVLLRAELSQQVEFVDIKNHPKGVFLVWADEACKKSFDKQTAIIAEAIKKKIPIIIFDKYQKMDGDEVSFLMKNGAFLWEPAVNDRMFFSFQPVWGRLITEATDIPWDFEEVRKIDLGYLSPLTKKMSSFRQYFEPVAEIGDFTVAYIDEIGSGAINKKVDEMGISIVPWMPHYPHEKVKMTMLLGTEQDYRVGLLDPRLFDYLEAGIVPMLPTEHRWYHSVFKDLTVSGEDQTEYFLRTADKIGFGSVYDIYNNLNENLPECNVVNVAKRILTFFK